MPVEIREVIIRAVLSDDQVSNQSTEGSATDKQNVVQECVSQVLKILKKQNRR